MIVLVTMHQCFVHVHVALANLRYINALNNNNNNNNNLLLHVFFLFFLHFLCQYRGLRVLYFLYGLPAMMGHCLHWQPAIVTVDMF